VEVLCEQRPRAAVVRSTLKAIGAPPAVIAYVPPKNWVAETQRLLAPLRIGGSSFTALISMVGRRAARSRCRSKPAIAFGTGRHETTRGCLLALDRLARSGRRIKRPLDLGCGSGVLALAMAHLWEVPVLAVDTDLNSVAVARENLRINRAAERVRVVKSHGCEPPPVRRVARRSDLIVANILAGPLCRLARGFGRNLAPGGYGHSLRADERPEPQVIAAQERRSLKLQRCWRSDDWSVLEFRRVVQQKRRPPRRDRRH